MEIHWSEIWFHLYHLAIAYGLSLPMALERETHSRSVGLRTFPLVALSSCGYMLTGMAVLEAGDAQARVMYGLMTGIGFIGGGAILKGETDIFGVATAASLWNTGAIGMSVALGQYEIALVLSLVNYLTLRWGRTVKREIDSSADEPE